MSETNVQTLLTDLKRAASHFRLYGATHHMTEVAIGDLAAAADKLAGTGADLRPG